MASGYRSGGVDFDDLFDPDVVGDGPQAAGLRSGGVPLRYAALSYGTKRADVGYRQGGVDVSNLWAAKGTARYVSDGGLPESLHRYLQWPPDGSSRTASVAFEYRTDGTVTWSDESGAFSGVWLGGGAAPGDYEIRFDPVSGGGFSGPTEQWLRLDANLGGGLSVTSSGTQTVGLIATINITLRKRSDLSVVFSRALTMSATVDRDV